MLNNDVVGDQQLINYAGPGQAILYCHNLTAVHVFKVLDAHINSKCANLTVTDAAGIDFAGLSSFVFAGADGVFFVGQIASVMTNDNDFIYVKFKLTESGHTLAMATPQKKSVYVTELVK